VQTALTHSPGLAYVPGLGFRHRYDSESPSPPPPPGPPPRNVYYGPAPPYPSPPPVSPPPFYQHAEACTPIPTATAFGLDLDAFRRENAGDANVEFRSACLISRRAIDKRRRAKTCFATVIPPSPPPPPTFGAAPALASAQVALDLDEQRRVGGESDPYAAAPKNEAETFIDELRGTIDETGGLIKALGGTNPILRDLLADSIGEMKTSIARASAGDIAASDFNGRRLMMRSFEYPDSMHDALVDHPIMKSVANGGYGREGIPGVRVGDCEAMCEALTTTTTNASDATECRAFAFKRAAPFSLTDVSGRCYLLQSAGACKVEDFAAGLYTRHIESEEQCHALRPGNDNPLCIQVRTCLRLKLAHAIGVIDRMYVCSRSSRTRAPTRAC
jgi:hypothetical protein